MVCNRHLFLGCAQKHSEVFGATKFHKNFNGSEIKTSKHPHLKRCGLISDINN